MAPEFDAGGSNAFSDDTLHFTLIEKDHSD